MNGNDCIHANAAKVAGFSRCELNNVNNRAGSSIKLAFQELYDETNFPCSPVCIFEIHKEIDKCLFYKRKSK